MNIARRKMVIPGGSGFLGKTVALWFVQRGWEVVVLSRQRRAIHNNVRFVPWDGRTLGQWTRELDGADVVLNLAGRSVNCRYSAANRQQIMDSRVLSTKVLGEAIAQCKHPPSVWLNSSTATIYKHSLDRPMDEFTGIIAATPEAKDAFSIEVAVAWEKTLKDMSTPRTRKIALRAAMVLGAEPGGVFQVLRRLVRLGLGGSMGHGNQYVSWIHEADFCRVVEWLIEHEDISGPVNLAAPGPIPNREMMRVLRQACGIPIGLPAARWMLEVGAFFLRTETELIVKSRRVVPGKLLAEHFAFRFPDIQGAIADLIKPHGRKMPHLMSSSSG